MVLSQCSLLKKSIDNGTVVRSGYYHNIDICADNYALDHPTRLVEIQSSAPEINGTGGTN